MHEIETLEMSDAFFPIWKAAVVHVDKQVDGCPIPQFFCLNFQGGTRAASRHKPSFADLASISASA